MVGVGVRVGVLGEGGKGGGQMALPLEGIMTLRIWMNSNPIKKYITEIFALFSKFHTKKHELSPKH